MSTKWHYFALFITLLGGVKKPNLHAMQAIQMEPMVKHSNQVQTTSDYSKFKTLFGNRKPNALHVKRLCKSFEKNYLFSPILINEHYQIIDGQHRFLAAKELGLPINYIVVNGYGLNEVQVLNTNSSNWDKYDYLKAYCDLGVIPYLQMNKFMQDFPDFKIGVAEQILTNTTNGVNNRSAVFEKKGRVKNFEEGKFSIPDLKASYDNAEKLLMFKPYFSSFNEPKFVSAMIGILKNQNYNHAEMLGKLAHQPLSLQPCKHISQYKLLIEDIYNYRRREKVSLRF